MNHSCLLRAGLLASLVACAGCGPDLAALPVTPSGPTTLTQFLVPPVPQVGGVWQGPLTLSVVGGGTGALRTAGSLDCAAAAFNQAITDGNDTNDSSLLLTEDAAGALTAKLTSTETGLACEYKGVVSRDNTIVLSSSPIAGTLATCNAPTLIMRCQPDLEGNAPARQLLIQGSNITATYDGATSTITGTASHTYNLLDAGGQPVGGLVASHTFSLQKR